MIFDARRTATPVFKERVLWLLFLAPFFFLTYGLANQLTSMRSNIPIVMFDWESIFPFIPEMIIPYMSLDILFGFSFLLVKTRDELQRHALRLGFTILFSVLLFLLLPLECSYQKPVVEGWTNIFFKMLESDLPYNQLPSLHISLGMVVGFMYIKHLRGWLAWIAAAWFVLIALSTVVVYQHHFIDLPTGVLLGVAAFYFVPTTKAPLIPLNFITPKHLGLGVRYLVVSIVFTVLAFKVAPAALLFSWIAFSFFVLACCYMLALNSITHKVRGRIHFVYWILFWPYILANHLTWRYFKAKVPLLVELKDGLWIGRSLAKKDSDLLKEANIITIIDLAPEIASYPPDDAIYLYRPVLDLSIPDPEILMQLCADISAAITHGRVLVHCKLGLSRSVIVACAWLMHQGRHRHEAWELLAKIHPMSVDKTYVHIALELFEQELKQNAISFEAKLTSLS